MIVAIKRIDTTSTGATDQAAANGVTNEQITAETIAALVTKARDQAAASTGIEQDDELTAAQFARRRHLDMAEERREEQRRFEVALDHGLPLTPEQVARVRRAIASERELWKKNLRLEDCI